MHSGRLPAPVDPAVLGALLSADPLWRWPVPVVVASTGSTNADLALRCREPEGAVLIAEEQTAGRGRLGRQWDSPAGAGIWMSVLLRPGPADWTWLPLLAGVAVCEAIAAHAGGAVDVGLKWPNDLLVGEAKAGGILIERHADAAVVGIGIDVHQAADDLAGYVAAGGTAATSLTAAGLSIDRSALIAQILLRLVARYREWAGALGDAHSCGLADAYRGVCRTLGARVRVVLSGDDVVIGDAVDVTGSGHLVVRTEDRAVEIAAGDVTRLRPFAP